MSLVHLLPPLSKENPRQDFKEIGGKFWRPVWSGGARTPLRQSQRDCLTQPRV